MGPVEWRYRSLLASLFQQPFAAVGCHDANSDSDIDDGSIFGTPPGSHPNVDDAGIGARPRIVVVAAFSIGVVEDLKPDTSSNHVGLNQSPGMLHDFDGPLLRRRERGIFFHGRVLRGLWLSVPLCRVEQRQR